MFVVLGSGVLLLLYGATFHTHPVYSKDNDKGLATAEPKLVLEASRGGLELKEDGKLHKTYTGAPPKACPT